MLKRESTFRLRKYSRPSASKDSREVVPFLVIVNTVGPRHLLGFGTVSVFQGSRDQLVVFLLSQANKTGMLAIVKQRVACPFNMLGSRLQETFYDRPEVLCISLHRPSKGDTSGSVGELGTGQALGRYLSLRWSTHNQEHQLPHATGRFPEQRSSLRFQSPGHACCPGVPAQCGSWYHIISI